MPSYGQIEVYFKSLYSELQITNERLTTMAGELEKIRAAVAKNTSQDESLRIVMEGLAEKVRSLSENAGSGGIDPAEVSRLADEIDASTDKMIAAVKAHTPTADTNPATTAPTPDPNADLASPPTDPDPAAAPQQP